MFKPGGGEVKSIGGFLFFVFLYSNLNAAVSCKTGLERLEIKAEKVITPSYKGKVQKLYTQIQKKLLTHMNTPKDLKLTIRDEVDMSKLHPEEYVDYEYSFGLHRITMYRNMIGRNGVKKGENEQLDHFVHEVGHAIMDANLEASPMLADFFGRMKKEGPLLIKSAQLDHFGDVLYDQKLAAKSKKQEEKVQKQMDALELEYELLSKQRKALKAQAKETDNLMFEIFFAYGEFFADLTTVVFRENPKAMRDAHYYEGLKTYGDYSYRDFASGKTTENWKVSNEVHNTLLPARTYIWERYLKDGKVFAEGKHSEFLKAVNDVLVKHIEERTLNEELNTLDANQRNHLLIERLEKAKSLEGFRN